MHTPPIVLAILALVGSSALAQIPPVLVPTAPVPYAGDGVVELAALRDANGDGLADLVSRLDFPLKLMVQLNQADGTFAEPIQSGTFSEDAYGTAFGDLDGDGLLDAAVGNPASDGVNVAVLGGDGTGAFQHLVSLSNGSGAFPLLAIGDVDGDGLGDIVSTTFSQISTLLGQPGKGFAPPLETATAEPVGEPVLGDVDLDGDLDVVQVSDSLNVDDASSMLRVSRGNGLGGFTTTQTKELFVRAQRAQLLHRNGDGDLDLLVYGLAGTHTGPGGLFLLENEGGSMQQKLAEPYEKLGFLTSDVVGGDLNGDGAAEVTVVRRGVFGGADEVRVNDGDGGFPVEVAFTGPVYGAIGLVGELTGDQLDELVIVEIPIGPTETFHIWENATQLPPSWIDLGHALAGAQGEPQLEGTGSLVALAPIGLQLAQAAPSAPVALVAGLAQLAADFKGGVLVPSPDLLLVLATDVSGTASLEGEVPAAVTSGLALYAQAWIDDGAGPQGWAASNALVIHAP